MLNRIEYQLNAYISRPFIGSLPAALKLGVGSVVMVGKLFFSLLALLPALCVGDLNFVRESAEGTWQNTKKIARSCAGLIPLVGTLVEVDYERERFFEALNKKEEIFNPFWLTDALAKMLLGTVCLVVMSVYFILRLLPNLYFRRDFEDEIEFVGHSCKMALNGMMDLCPFVDARVWGWEL